MRTLALMMVGRGSRIPCIFLRAGMTKRLQVTTADTGLPANVRERGRERGRERATLFVRMQLTWAETRPHF